MVPLTLSVFVAAAQETPPAAPEIAVVIPGAFTSGIGETISVVVLGAGLATTEEIYLVDDAGLRTPAISFEIESDVSIIADFPGFGYMPGKLDFLVVTSGGEALLTDAIAVLMDSAACGRVDSGCPGLGGKPPGDGGGEFTGFGGGSDLVPSSLLCTVSDGRTEGFPGLEGASVTLDGGTYTASPYRTGIYAFSLVPAGTYELEVSVPGFPPCAMRVTVASGRTSYAGFKMGLCGADPKGQHSFVPPPPARSSSLADVFLLLVAGGLLTRVPRDLSRHTRQSWP